MITLFEGFKDNINKQIELNKKTEVYTPGSFIIVDTYRWSGILKQHGQILFLLKIIKYDKAIGYFYVEIQILDYISSIKQDVKIDEITHMDVESQEHKILFKSNSKIEAISKFEKLKEEYPYKEWILKNDMGKYNI
jgi:hypothetical protein